MSKKNIGSEQTQNACPFVRFGNGDEIIVIFPPINDSIFTMKDIAQYAQHLFKSLSRDYTIYVIGRRRDLPVGYGTRDMARDYAETFALLSLGAVNLIGVSLGGMIAQHFTYDYPRHIKRLILIGTAHHMGPEGLEIARRWIPWARRSLWKEITEETINITFHGMYRLFLQILKPFLIRYYLRQLKNTADFIISGEAGILHDSSQILASLAQPVLILGGTADRFFPESLFHEMDQKIPNCHLLLVKGARHGVLEQHKKACLEMIGKFLKK
ncbi:MAG: alpha/beta hydrolase [Candidatus Omnitrophica bacterium]|nr:alpha/beta hydrolase [Candidatus Omnitrophota bacterium]